MAVGGPGAARSLNDWGVLALLAERPAHGFQLAKAFAKEGELGLVWAIQRQQVYRALEHLERDGLVRRLRQEEGGSGPPRTVYAATEAGQGAVATWLEEPVERLRQVRHALLLKLAFLARRGRDADPLLAAQRPLAERMVVACERRLGGAPPTERIVLAWRLESARALLRFLDELGDGTEDGA
jgi:DNA-binding PadR family transcriptional regulator